MANRPAYEVQAQEWTTTSLLSREGGPRDRKPARLKHYRPTATKPWVFVAFLCGVATCIAFLEYAVEVQHRPSGSSSIAQRAYLDHGSELDGPDEAFHDYPRRQTTGAVATTDAAATTNAAATTGAAATTVHLVNGPLEASELALAAATSAAISIAVTSLESPLPSAEPTLTTTSTTVPTATPSALDEVTPVTSPTTVPTASGGSPLSSEMTPNAPSTNFGPAKATSTAASRGFPSSSETTPNAPSTNFSPAKTTALAPASSGDMASFATPALTVVPGMASPSDEMTVTGTSTLKKTTTIVAAPGATTLHGSNLGLAENFTGADYFLAMYLPTFLTVLLRSGWAIIFAAMKMMEPFYQLARRGGASAEESLLANYLSGGLSLDTLRAMWRGNRVLLLAGLVHLGTALVVSLAGESMSVRPTSYCHTHVSTHQPCEPVWVINQPVVRVMEALLCVIFVLVVVLLFHTRRRFSGVFSDPSWISSMADLLGHPAFVEDLRNIPPFATAGEVKAALAGNWYMLTSFEIPGGRLRYGVVKTEEGPPPSSSLPPSQTPASYMAFPNLEYQHHYSPPPKSWQASVAGLLDVGFFLLALFSIILAYWFLSGDDPLNNFFNSDTFGPRFLLTGGAVVAGSGWKRFEREARIMEPYRRMANRRQPAHAEDSVYASPTGTPFSTVFVALARRSYAVAVIAAVALLSQVLIIAVPGVPFSEGQIMPAYRASTFVSLAILGIMVLAFVVVVARRRGDPPMPRDPDTPVHVWLYLCASRMVDTSRGLEVVGNRVYPYRDCGNTAGVHCSYWYALSTGVDARKRWMVDEDRYHVYMNYKDR